MLFDQDFSSAASDGLNWSVCDISGDVNSNSQLETKRIKVMIRP